MKLLIVEDDEFKAAQLTSFMERYFKNFELRYSKSLISGIRSAKEFTPDLVLLDMTLPNYDLDEDSGHGGMHAFGGMEFLRQLRRARLTPDVIVVTQFETFGEGSAARGIQEVDSELRAEFHDVYRGLVYYHASLTDWFEQLRILISEAVLDK